MIKGKSVCTWEEGEVCLDPMKSSGLLSNFTATQYEQDNQGFSFLLNEAQVIPLG